jgi:putative DNA methylase
MDVNDINKRIRTWLNSKPTANTFKLSMHYPLFREMQPSDLHDVSQTQRRLPHWELADSTYFITFRVTKGLFVGQASFRQGPFSDPDLTDIVEESLWYGHGDRYAMDAYVIMPDHIHVLLRPLEGCPLSRILKDQKGFTARQLNKKLSRNGPFWQDERHDHLIRNPADWVDKFEYIHNNPVKAGLVSKPQEYPYSSLVTWYAKGRRESWYE